MNKPNLAPKDDMAYRIAFAQSWNLAVAIVEPIRRDMTVDQTKETLEFWQQYFYQKLALDFAEDLEKKVE